MDDARIPWRGERWSHLVADSASELFGAAEALGLQRNWVQDKGRTLHFDLPDQVRERAIASGIARPIHWRELVSRRVVRKGARRGSSTSA